MKNTMKSKLLTLSLAFFAAFSTQIHAQSTPATLGAAIITSGFDTWSSATVPVPTGWESAPATTINPDSVTHIGTTNTTYSVYGTYACRIENASATYTNSILATAPVSVTAGMAYQVTYLTRGKGTVNIGVTDGSSTPGNYASANGQTVKGAKWFYSSQTVIAPVTTANAQFFLEVKSTGTYSTTTSGGISITGVDIDSFIVRPYTPVNNVSLYNIQYTAATSGNSPFNGQFVTNTGGIITAITKSSTGSPTGYYLETSGSNAWGACLVYDYTNAPNVAAGDSVTLTGAVSEYFNMTELQQVSTFIKVSSGNKVPAPIVLQTQNVGQEMYESALVQIQGVIVPTFSNTGNQNYDQGTAIDSVSASQSGTAVTIDTKTGLYPTAPYVPTITASFSSNPIVEYCMTGNINYEFSAYNLVPRGDSDIVANCKKLVAGIEKYSNNVNAHLYPNPVAGDLTIALPFVANHASVSFTDVLGREVFTSSNLSGAVLSISNINLPTGVYTVKIVADGKTQVSKIIKQ
jgi:hypothetical protein